MGGLLSILSRVTSALCVLVIKSAVVSKVLVSTVGFGLSSLTCIHAILMTVLLYRLQVQDPGKN